MSSTSTSNSAAFTISNPVTLQAASSSHHSWGLAFYSGIYGAYIDNNGVYHFGSISDSGKFTDLSPTKAPAGSKAPAILEFGQKIYTIYRAAVPEGKKSTFNQDLYFGYYDISNNEWSDFQTICSMPGGYKAKPAGLARGRTDQTPSLSQIGNNFNVLTKDNTKHWIDQCWTSTSSISWQSNSNENNHITTTSETDASGIKQGIRTP
ncbi:MAG: hypothetical protein AAF585_16715, partial [Verrucomicrobiota bacterium]